MLLISIYFHPANDAIRLEQANNHSSMDRNGDLLADNLLVDMTPSRVANIESHTEYM